MEVPRQNTYSVADIQRYHDGNMIPAEMHALEKAALDDPFLADAIDGYVHTSTPAADVAFLKKRLQRRGKVVPLHTKRRFVLSIAALLILLAGFGWLAFQFSDPFKHNMAIQTNMKQA